MTPTRSPGSTPLLFSMPATRAALVHRLPVDLGVVQLVRDPLGDPLRGLRDDARQVRAHSVSPPSLAPVLAYPSSGLAQRGPGTGSSGNTPRGEGATRALPGGLTVNRRARDADTGPMVPSASPTTPLAYAAAVLTGACEGYAAGT